MDVADALVVVPRQRRAGRRAVVEDDQLEAKGLEVATKLAEGAQTSIRFTKYALNNWLRMMGPTFDASTALEMLGFLGPEVKEGLASHLEKRKPKFAPPSRHGH